MPGHGRPRGHEETHDTTERLSWFLFAPVSTKRPGFERAQLEMKDLCTKCHGAPGASRLYRRGRARLLEATNFKVKAATDVVQAVQRGPADGRGLR